MKFNVLFSRRKKSNLPLATSFLFIVLSFLFTISTFGYYAPLAESTTYSINGAGDTITVSVEDPYRTPMLQTYSASISVGTTPIVSNGVVSWFVDSTTVRVLAYDPAMESPWTFRNILNVNNYKIKGGTVVAFDGDLLKYLSYLCGGSWVIGSTDVNALHLEYDVGNGVVAAIWTSGSVSYSYLVSFCQKASGGYVTRTTTYSSCSDCLSSLSINDCDTVQYSISNVPHIWGYVDSVGDWVADTPTETMAYHYALKTQPNNIGLPENVWWFYDVSKAASTWTRTFGDGYSSTDRSPSHPYAVSGTFPMLLSVTGCSSADTYSHNVANSFDAPTGSISIDDSDPTYDRNVDLSFTAAGSPDKMRLKNDDLSWGAWENVSTAIANWELTDGYGTKTVSVQFKNSTSDLVSPIYSDQIDYDPLLTVTFPNGGEYFQQGNTYRITFDNYSPNIISVVLQKNDMTVRFFPGIALGATYFDWDIPLEEPQNYLDDNSPLAGNSYKIKIYDSALGVSDKSDGTFTICKLKVLTPNGGETIGILDNYLITWSHANLPSGLFRITLWQNDVLLGEIARDLPIGTASYLWDVSEFPVRLRGEQDLKIKVKVMGTQISDMSDNTFSIN